MYNHSTKTAAFFSVLIAALIFSLALAGVAAAQGNTTLGTSALQNNTTGQFNTAIGLQALFSNSTGDQNTAGGVNALFSNTNGDYNTASGVNTLLSNTTGSANTAGGVNALFSNTTGSFNLASGFNALALNTTGEQNTAGGVNALFSNTTGSFNLASGVNALAFNTTGNGNIALGFNAGSNLTTGNNNIAIGNPGVGGESGIIRLGTPGTHTNTLLSGNVGIGTPSSPTRAKLEVVGSITNQPNPGNVSALFSTGVSANIPAGVDPISIYATSDIFSPVFIAFSDARIKNIEGRSDGAGDLATLAGIEVTNYTYIDTAEKGSGKQKKVIGQQVEEVYPQAVSRSTDVVPDIYKKAQVKDGWVGLATNLKKGERIRLIGKVTEGIHEVLEVAEGKFRTDFAADGDEVFVYGREVKDFRNVDYDAIAMLNVSATQELNRRLKKQAADLVAQAEEMSKQTTRIAELEQDRQAQAMRIAELEKQASEIAMLKQQMAALQAVGLTAGRLDTARLEAAR
jgi:hypothetical protein